MDSMEKQFSGITPKDAYIEERNRVIIRTSILGITANVVLALLKALVGMATHSIAITLDAVNNFTDAGSSVITIAGTKLASKKPDKKHPWGHGLLRSPGQSWLQKNRIKSIRGDTGGSNT